MYSKIQLWWLVRDRSFFKKAGAGGILGSGMRKKTAFEGGGTSQKN